MTESLEKREFGSLDALASTDCVVYDVDAERVSATFDETRDSAAVAVVSVLATVLGRDPLELPPLYRALEPGALEAISTDSSTDRGTRAATTVQYLGFDVTVTSGGTIEAVPTDTGGGRTMSEEISRPDVETGQIVEQGETYCHEEYGAIEVTGIWCGTRPEDSAPIGTNRTVVVRYAPGDDCKRTADLADTLVDFLAAIE